MAKPKLTPEVLERAVQLKKGGANNKDICAAIGIAEQTFYRWMNSPRCELERSFSESLKKAEADYKNALLAIIARDAREKDWKAAAWLLERKYPDEYARTQRVVGHIETMQRPDALTQAIEETVRQMESAKDAEQ